MPLKKTDGVLIELELEPEYQPLSSPLLEGRITLCLIVSALAASISTSFLVGYNISVMTGPSRFMHLFYNKSHYDQYGFHLSKTQEMWLWAFTIAIFCVGGSIGALIATRMSDSIGRRGTLLLTCLITITAACLMGVSQYVNVYQLVIAGRFVIGMSAGIGLVTTPLYLSEISPVKYRGGIAGIHQLGVSVGIFVAQILGLYPLYSQELWPLLLAATGIVNLIGCSILFFCPESPRWYIITSSNTRRKESTTLLGSHGNRYKAVKSLKRLRGTANVDSEIEEMLHERNQESLDGAVGMMDVIRLKNPMWKWPLLISIILHSSQQLGGINAVMYYTTELFAEASLTEDVIKIATCGTGLVTIITDILTIFLVDRLGRRFFLLVSYSVMAFATVFMTVALTANGEIWSFLAIVAVYIFLLGFSPGPGAMTMVIVPEIWTQGPRSAAISIAGQFNWWSNFVVGLAFPFMLDGLDGYSFLIFTTILVFIILFLYFCVPETRNKTFLEISSTFKKKSSS